MKVSEVNQLVNQINANLEAAYVKTFKDFYEDVKAGKVVPVTDNTDNIIGFNTVKEKPTSLKVCKMVNGKMTVGDTEEDRAADEVAMRKFVEEYPYNNLKHWFEIAYMLSKSNIVFDEVIYPKNNMEDVDNMILVNTDKKLAYNIDGDIVMDCSDDPDLKGASKNVIVRLMKASL